MASYDDTGTVSGSIVRVNDGADSVGLKNWLVTLPASLSGYSAVECNVGGKNFLPLAVDYPNYTNTKNSVTLTVLSDGKVKLNGTASANTDFTFYSASTPSDAHLYVRNGTYTFSNIGNSNVKMVVSGGNNNGFPYREIANGSYTGTVTDETKPFNYIIFRISSGTQLDNVVVEPMLEYGSSASSFEPYTAPTTATASLGRTIYGGSVDVVKGTGSETYLKYVVDGVNNYAVNISGTNFNIMPYGLTGIDGTTANWVCDTLTANNTNFGYNSSNGFIFFRQAAWSSLSGVTDVATFNAYCQEHPITFLFPLTTATDFTFTPITPTPETPLGVSNWWADEGESEITYYKDGYGTTSVTIHKETPDGEPVEQTAKLHKIVYGGLVDVVKGKAEPKNWIDDNLSNLEPGTINGNTGADESANNRVRNINAIPFPYDEIASSYRWTFPSGYKAAIRPFDANGNYVSLPSWAVGFVASLPQDLIGQGIVAMKFVLAKNDNSAITPNDMKNVGYLLEKGSTATSYAPFFSPFSFPPISMETDEGENTLYADEGDSAITYRKAVD